MNGKSAAVYIHVPFCHRKCDYCHFYVISDKERYRSIYLDALEKEWRLVSSKLKEYEIASIYFGGGTPALLPPGKIEQILRWFTYLPDCEITLEANPEDIDEQIVSCFLNAGINRISLGIQSFDNNLLRILSRRHSAKKAVEAVQATKKAGIKNISIDLMYDIPSQTVWQWKRTLEVTKELPVQHLSLYNLTFEPHTVFYKKKEILLKQVPNESSSCQMLEEACKRLPQMGLSRYEISAFAKKGFESRHNSCYWTGQPFLGLGPSAFSYWGGKRFRNVAHLNRYCQSLAENISPVDYEEPYNPQESIRELFVLRLRFIGGFSLSQFESKVGFLENETKKQLGQLKSQGLIQQNHDWIKLTELGLKHYDTVAAELI